METAWNFWVSTIPSGTHWESMIFTWLGVTWVLAAGLRRFAPAQCPVMEVESGPGHWKGDQFIAANSVEVHRSDTNCRQKCFIFHYHVLYRDPWVALPVAFFWPIYLWLVLPLGVLCVLFFGSFWFISNVGRRTA